MYAIDTIDGNIYHQYTPNVSIYTSTMDPMAMGKCHRNLTQEMRVFLITISIRSGYKISIIKHVLWGLYSSKSTIFLGVMRTTNHPVNMRPLGSLATHQKVGFKHNKQK